MAAAVPIAMVVGTGIKLYSNYQAGKAEARQGRANARLAEAAAADAQQRGEQEAAKARMSGDMLAGQQMAAYGHAGVDVGSGSAARTISQTAMLVELDAQIIRNNAARQAWGYRMQGRNFRAAARDAERASYLNLAGGIVGAAGSIAGAGR
ncbi:MAG TPA: hypothetical protein VLS93_13430 [Anaeromyxobacteraceae bacterium]|nr:hypothetical protein [Anaeromyxobacteraceae bacterium]